ncbi:MAG: bifunctional (p)ppGpp synthetase/guanosine-3',5'-bis(diphosphate) 3'-pyrophosphohydrolase [Acidobacteria bacterium]|nr:bifunctional (p)ppGpp synthetase/guanosine-3',5'-bis(diphosphate) 3'-pyrophosphohydrolase [Acidobacteriota bacterium]
MNAPAKVRIEDILDRVERYRPDMDEVLLRHAYVFAANRHQGQVRRSGEAYLIHPLSVAWILADMELDEVAIAAGLLHDILEDTETSPEEMELEFGPVVTRLVVALTKLSSFESKYESREATEAENFRRLLLASTDDVRVILVKLADRLHNMRTLGFLRPERQVAIARETLDIYAPIANRLGIGSIKAELEDLCFRYLHPQDAERLEKAIGQRSQAAEKWFGDLKVTLDGILEKAGIAGTVEGRIKHLYSIWQKLKRQGVEVESVFDFLAFRIIVSSVADCYAAMGLIHQQWPPVPGRIKDYIAIPKPNAYQSLHTTVIGPEGHPFEIQIRTEDMHAIAEHGIAAHWSYKERGSQPADDSRIAWLRGLLDTTQGSSPREFLDSLKVDLYPEEVYCFTPRGDVFSFPRGATVLDFAYRIHTDVGHHCVGATVNGRWVPLKTELNNGDIVEVSTSNQQKPHHDWLDIAASGRARSKIRAWLKREEKDRAEEVGRKLLEKELRRLGKSWKRVAGCKEMEELLKARGMASEETLLAAIGFGRLAAPAVAEELAGTAEAGREPALPASVAPIAFRKEAPVLEVTGDSDFLVYRAKCCNPLPGEEIVGYVTRGKGVAVHSRSCPNVQKLLYHPEREIEVRWADGAVSERSPKIRIELDMRFRDRAGLLAAISQVVAREGSNILSCNLHTADGALGTVTMTVEVRDKDHLNRIMDKLRGVEGMVDVERRGAFRRVAP